jgi:AcrR family transcriptional regulator
LVKEDAMAAAAPKQGRREIGLADRRSRLIKAAADLILERDNGAFSMPELAARAGLSLATPYNLIGSKAAVLSQVFDRQIRGFHSDTSWRCEDSPAQRALGLIDRLIDVLSVKERFFRNLWKALYSLGPNEHGRFPAPESGHIVEPLVKSLARDGLIPEAVPDSVLDATLQRIFDAAFAQWAAQDWPMTRLHTELRASFALVLIGICPDTDRPVLEAALKK